MTDLTCIIDSIPYVRENCYQHQLSLELESRFNVTYVPISEVDRVRSLPGIVMSRLKLRTLDRTLKSVQAALSDRPVFIYEQDPWESFIVSSPHFGSYKRINDSLNVTSFLNTSTWWSDQVRALGIRSRFVQMWMHPSYCREPIPWAKRKKNVVFCGTMYPRRQKFFDALEKAGTKVEIVKSGFGYRSYLDLVADCKMMIRSERVEWDVELASGRMMLNDPHALWIRDVECASQGCFSSREHDDEYVAWNLSRIFSATPFVGSVDEAREVVDLVLSIPADDADAIVQASIAAVKTAPGWSTVSATLLDS